MGDDREQIAYKNMSKRDVQCKLVLSAVLSACSDTKVSGSTEDRTQR